MKNQELRTFILIIKGSEGNKDFKAEVEAKDQNKALAKILSVYPHLRKDFDRDYLLENLGIKMN